MKISKYQKNPSWFPETKSLFFPVFFVFVFAAEEYGGLHESLMVVAPLFIEFAILPDVPWTDHELVKQGNFMRTKYNAPETGQFHEDKIYVNNLQHEFNLLAVL